MGRSAGEPKVQVAEEESKQQIQEEAGHTKASTKKSFDVRSVPTHELKEPLKIRTDCLRGPAKMEEPLAKWEERLEEEKEDFQRWIDASEWTKWETTRAGTDVCYTMKGKGGSPVLWCRQEFEQNSADSATVIEVFKYMITSGYSEYHDPNLKELKWLAKSKCGTRVIKYKHLKLPWPLWDRLMVVGNVTEQSDKHITSWGASVHDLIDANLPKRTIHCILRSRHRCWTTGPGKFCYDWVAQIDPNGMIPIKIMLWAKGHVSKQVTKSIRMIENSDFKDGIEDFQRTLKEKGLHGFKDLWNSPPL